MDQSVASTLPTTEEDQLLLAIADGGYLVAAGDGIVRECGADLAERVGVSVGDAVGRPVTDLLRGSADGKGAAGFTAALAGPERGFAVVAAAGAPLRARVVPVPLTLGWEVTSLLGDLGMRDTDTWSSASLRAQHGPAIDAILDTAPTEPGARLAGILVIVRPPAGERLDREGIAERRARRAATALVELATERESAVAAVTAPRPVAAVATPAAAPADDALSDLVEQARELRRRLDDAAAAAASAAAERDAARVERDEAAEARDALAGALEAAHQERERLLADYEETARQREALHADGDEAARGRDALQAQLMELEAEQDGLTGRLAEATAHGEALAARLTDAMQAHAALVAERDALAGARDAVTAERDVLAAERDALTAERDGERQARAAAETAAEQARVDLREHVEQARAGAADAGQLVAELDQVRAAGIALREELDRTQAELHQARTTLAHAEAEGEQARAAHEQARAELEQVRADLAAVGAERDAAARRVRELAEDAARVQSAATTIRSELGLDLPAVAAAPAPAPVPASAPVERAELPSVPGRAFAVVGPDGCFTRLDEAFCGLLGYREADLLQAGWPSIIDSDNAREHRELARALRAGERPEAEVQTFYMHACGLLVGVVAHVRRSQVPGLDSDHLLVDVDVTNAAAPAAHRP